MGVKYVKFGAAANGLSNARGAKTTLPSIDNNEKKADRLREFFFGQRRNRSATSEPIHEAVTILLPVHVVAIWKSQGEGWESRMAELVSLLAR
jgi:uncharacterized protein (DUF4415 family)